MRLSTTIVLGCALGFGLASTAFAQGTGRSLDIQPGARQNATALGRFVVLNR